MCYHSFTSNGTNAYRCAYLRCKFYGITLALTADENGWVEYSRGSLNGSKYIVIDKSMTFYGAQDQCRKHGGYLVHVNTIREQVFIEDFLLQEMQLDGKCDCAVHSTAEHSAAAFELT